MSGFGKKAWKFVPFVRVDFPPREPLRAPPGPVPAPRGFRLEETGGERIVSWRWVSLRSVGTLLFILLWDAVLAVVLFYASPEGAPPRSASALLLTLTAFGAAATYAGVAYLVNRTSVRVDAAQVSVRHGPLPWSGARDASKADIERVFSERHALLDDDGGFEPNVTYKVVLLLKGGARRVLVSGLRAPEQALFIEQLIRE